MEKIAATQILALALECSGKASESVKLVKDTCTESDFIAYRQAAAQVIAHIFLNILVPIYEEYQDLAPEWYRAYGTSRGA